MKYQDYEQFEKANIFGMGKANEKYAKYFIGESFLKSLTKDETGVHLSNVIFEPGCRNNWHVHHAKSGGGQLLLCIAGEGWYQEEGKPPVSLEAGSVVVIPANVNHWHGAKADSWFSHLAMAIAGEETSTEWREPVGEEEYQRLEEV